MYEEKRLKYGVLGPSKDDEEVTSTRAVSVEWWA